MQLIKLHKQSIFKTKKKYQIKFCKIVKKYKCNTDKKRSTWKNSSVNWTEQKSVFETMKKKLHFCKIELLNNTNIKSTWKKNNSSVKLSIREIYFTWVFCKQALYETEQINTSNQDSLNVA